MESPNIWVFTNELPPMDSLSSDRWNIWTIDNNNFELKPFKEKNNIEIDYIECPPNIQADHVKPTESQLPKKEFKKVDKKYKKRTL